MLNVFCGFLELSYNSCEQLHHFIRQKKQFYLPTILKSHGNILFEKHDHFNFRYINGGISLVFFSHLCVLVLTFRTEQLQPLVENRALVQAGSAH